MIVEIIEILIGGLLVGLASSVTVGPVAVLCIQRTLSRGYLSGIFSGFGVASADTLMAILAFTLYALLKDYIDKYDTIILSCGGVFVIIVGIFIFFKNPVPQIRKNRAGKTFLWQDFASMFGFTLANFVVIIPYILAFFAMFNIDLSGHKSSEEVEEKSIEDVRETTVEIATGEVVSYDSLEAATASPSAGKVPNVEYVVMVGEQSQSDNEDKVEEAVGVDASKTQVTAEDESTVNDKSSRVGGFVYNVLIILGFLLGAMAWWLALTAIINLFRKGFRPRHMLTINHIAGVVIGVLGIYTLLSVLIK